MSRPALTDRLRWPLASWPHCSDISDVAATGQIQEFGNLHKLVCLACYTWYVGQTGRCLWARFNEHIRYILTNNLKSAYACIFSITGMIIDLQTPCTFNNLATKADDLTFGGTTSYKNTRRRANFWWNNAPRRSTHNYRLAQEYARPNGTSRPDGMPDHVSACVGGVTPTVLLWRWRMRRNTAMCAWQVKHFLIAVWFVLLCCLLWWWWW